MSGRNIQYIGEVSIPPKDMTDVPGMGKPFIRGTTITTRRVWRLYQKGGIAEVLSQFPVLTERDITAAVLFEEKQNEHHTLR